MGQLWGHATSQNSDVQTWLASHTEHNAALKEHLSGAQYKYKQFADQKRSDREFAVGEMVYLRLQPYAQSTVVNRPCHKLALKYFGPYKVLDKVGNAAYRLELPRGSQVHPVFHVSQLKGHVPDHTPVFTSLPVPMDLSVPGVVPEEILDRLLVKKKNTAHLQILVKWAPLPAASATWEDYDILKLKFPRAPVWVQAGSSGEGTVSSTEQAIVRTK